MSQNYPLSWPLGRARTPVHVRKDGRFVTKSTNRLTIADACDRLYSQTEALGATHVIISTNIEPTLSGRPRSTPKAVEDPGVAVYFNWRKKTLVFACDKWSEVAQNIAAIAAHIEALRGQERWGVATTEEAFTGHMALPAPTALEAWWDVFGVQRSAPSEVVLAAYRKLAGVAHPDAGGSHESMSRLNMAKESFEAERRVVAP